MFKDSDQTESNTIKRGVERLGTSGMQVFGYVCVEYNCRGAGTVCMKDVSSAVEHVTGRNQSLA